MKPDVTFLDRIRSRPILFAEAMLEHLALPIAAVAAVLEALAVFEDNYPILAGQLRADDALEGFMEHGARNPFTWLFAQARVEDRLSELNYRLTQQRRSLGVGDITRSPMTVREFVLVWLGHEI